MTQQMFTQTHVSLICLSIIISLQTHLCYKNKLKTDFSIINLQTNTPLLLHLLQNSLHTKISKLDTRTKDKETKEIKR